ncbi:MlaD family protein [Arcobacter sp. FWKO B]|uniref:MlaD family protein n=1 Tax=Arcobacter sp. FWKO B TaxID=2593672 RepID=UPI0018A393C6|nr:MlaD family protein [Arcobacter sp. FWKO B]QOG13011.1 MCE family protein [Arcobacter sp. FWKO B]
METRVNYMLVGLFVVTVFVGLIIFLLWHTNYSQSKHYNYYKINIKESVAGLNQKAPVKLRGVNVGEVDKIFINPDNTEEVSIIIKVDSKTPIKVDSYALLKPQGITGLIYLEIEGGSNKSEILKSDNYDEMATIAVKQSLFTMVDRSFESLINKLAMILNDKNIENFEKLLDNSAKSSEHIAKISKSLLDEENNIKEFISQAKYSIKALENMSNVIAKIGTDDATLMLSKITAVAESINTLVEKIDQKVVEQNIMPLEGTLSELNLLIIETNSLIQRLQESPSDLFFKSTPKKLGPGEHR